MIYEPGKVKYAGSKEEKRIALVLSKLLDGHHV
jgi:hypothetical protein